jgi:hypothetical protein
MLITPVASYNPLSVPLLLPLLEPELPPLELDEPVPLLEPELPELPPLELEPPETTVLNPDGHWVAQAEHSFVVAADRQAADGVQAAASVPVGQAHA